MIGTDLIRMVLDERYEISELIGEGGMAYVFRAKDLRTKHDVAVKILKPDYNNDKEFIERFDREAAAASKMSHHNIVNLLDVGQSGEYRYLVMEYVKGKTLKDIIDEQGSLSPEISAQIALRVLSALQHAHSNGIIHRDIKPQNILVHSDGHIKVADFGIARMVGSGTLTKDDKVMGSVYYFSPEQAQGKDVTVASDIYSVGVMMYEMLTGHVPFDGETQVSVAMQQLSADPPPMKEFVPNIPPSLEKIVLKAMEKDPEQRYRSAYDMAQDIHRALHQPDGSWMDTSSLNATIAKIAPEEKPTTKPNPLQTIPTATLKKRLLTLLACVAAVAVLVYGTFLIYDRIVNTVTVPYVLGETEDNAKKMCIKAGLKVEISRANDPDTAAGNVMLQTPEYETKLKRGETVLLTVSLGPFRQPAPKIVGMQLQDAQTVLDRIDVNLFVTETVSTSQPQGTILSQNPAEGEMVMSGGIIKVTISGGSIELSDLSGQKLEDVLEKMEKDGITVAEIKELRTSDASLDGIVVSQQYRDKDQNPYQIGDRVTANGTNVILAVYVYDGETR